MTVRLNLADQLVLSLHLILTCLPSLSFYQVSQVPWNDEEVDFEPRFDLSFDSRVKESQMWPSPHFARVVNGCINVTNHNEEPVCVRKLESICKIYQATDANTSLSQVPTPIIPTPSLKKFGLYSSSVALNTEGVLSNSIEISFQDLVKEYDEVFNSIISSYNGYSGLCSVDINIRDI